LNADAVPSEPLREMLKSSNPDAQHTALMTVWKMNRDDIASRAELLEILNNPHMDNIQIALSLINRQTRVGVGANPATVTRPGNETTRSLTSSEAAALATNRFAQVRLMSLRVFQRNADTRAIELTLPLLRDSNVIVRNRAFAAIKAMTGEGVSDDDASKWERWWETNKGLQERAVAR
jgi:HEAT repeat protein